ncbi:protein PALS2-like [Sycon ciliatum]|uniref:protein PALS2-like n=1 Tax=Sycon ciliatum TaxID=27933 RepID=UPI0031F711E8
MEENGARAETGSTHRRSHRLLDGGVLRGLLSKPEHSELVDAYQKLSEARAAAAATGAEPFRAGVCLQRWRSDLVVAARQSAALGWTHKHSEDEDADREEAGVGSEFDNEQSRLDQLLELFRKPHFNAVMDTYDAVESQKEEEEAPKSLSPLPVSPKQAVADASAAAASNGAATASSNATGGGGERPVKQVGIRRNPNEKLGIVLKADGDDVVISRILIGLGADRQGLLHVGDVICEVDGVSCAGRLDLAEELVRKANGSFTIKLVPSPMDVVEHAPLFYRALFDYDPTTDSEHPFQSGGLPFTNGDILEVVNSEDASWWQARKADSENRKTGLIPARGLQERRFASKRNPSQNGSGAANGGGSVGCLGIRKSKPKAVMYSSAHNADFDRHDIITYEEVVKTSPQQRRVVALIGAQGVGRRGLKYRLITASREKYATTLPTTSRPRRDDEEDGVQYYFSGGDGMAREVKTPAYLESGEYNGFLYGTKTDSVREVIADEKICLLDVNPNALKRLRTAEFKPYVIFIKAPDFETLKVMHKEAAAANNQEAANAYTDQDLHRTLQESEHIEKLYQHMFDTTIVNDNIEQTYHQLQERLAEIDTDEQWVPASWMI